MSEPKKRVLLVDDEPSIVKMVGKQLEHAGYEVLVAVDGEEGLAKARTGRPDLIILDLMMPKRSGLEVCAILRQEEGTRRTPVILYSGKGKPMSQERLKEWGADAYVGKLSGTAELLKHVETLLATPRD